MTINIVLFWVLIALLLALLVRWLRGFFRHTSPYDRFSDRDVRGLYSLALRSHDAKFVKAIINLVAMRWGDGKAYHRLNKHLHQGINGWVPPKFSGPVEEDLEYIDRLYGRLHKNGSDGDVDLSEFEA